MENHDFDALLTDAVQTADPAKRDRAIRQLLAFAERVAATRNPGHAESVAASAVASLHQKISSRELTFESPAQLLAFLRRVALGKAVDRVRNDGRHLGKPSPGTPEGDTSVPGEPIAPGGSASTIVGRQDLEGFVHAWLGRVPASIRPAVATHMAEVMSRLEPDQRLGTLQELESELEDLAGAVGRVLGMFPDVLRNRATARISRTPFAELSGMLLQMEGLLLGARELRAEHRLAVEMREAGWEPKEIGEKLGISPGNVRVIHHRLAQKLMGQGQSQGVE